MDLITERERGLLQKIVTNDVFEVMQKIATQMLINWNKPIDTETEWTAARDGVARDERKKALNSFLETLEKLAHDT